MNLRLRRLALTITAVATMANIVMTATVTAEESPQQTTPVSFSREIRPIFQRDCVGCHQPAKNKGDYIMTTFAALLAGSDPENPVIIPGKPKDSFLIEQITPIDGTAEMPPEKPPLHDSEIALIARWISEGAVNDSPAGANQSYSAENPPSYFGNPTITSLDVDPTGEYLAVSGFHEVLVFGAADNDLKARLVGLAERVQSVRFSPDGKMLAVAGGSPGTNGEIQIWNHRESKLLLSASFTFDTLYGISWSPDSSKVAFGAGDKAVRAISVPSGELVLFQGSHDDWVLDTTFSNDGQYVISVGRDMTAKLTELTTQRFIDNITSITPGALKGGINAVETHPGGDYILFGGADGVPRIYRYMRQTKREIGDDANLLMELPAMKGRIFDIAFNSDGSKVVAVSSNHGAGSVTLSSVSTDLEPDDGIKKILVKPTHTRNQEEISKLREYFGKKATQIGSLEIPETPLYSADFSADGKMVFVAGKMGRVYRIDASSATIMDSFQVAPELVSVDLAGRDMPSGVRNPSADWILPNERPKELGFATLPKEVTIKSLQATPSAIAIGEPAAYNQLVIEALSDDGNKWDVSRLVNYQHDSGIIEVTRSGFVTPLRNGQGTLTVSINGIEAQIPVAVSGQDQQLTPNWGLHVNPVISRLGCNAGTCHGAKDGKNGFKLSLRGYDPVMDMTSLTDDLASRRVNFASPTRSLMLLKSSSEIPHEGGQLVNPQHDYYKILEDWILNGGQVEFLPEHKVTHLTVYPVNPVVQSDGTLQQMRITAHYPDGSQRDVTREAFLESGNTEVAEKVSGWPGLVTTFRRGEAPLLVRYEGAYVSTTLTVMGDRSGFVWVEPPFNNQIDRLVATKWKRMKILPSGLSDDHTFVRRIYLDLTGLPPTPDQVDSFVNAGLPTEEKRNILIDELLHSEAYVDHWSNKWADLLQVNGKFLGKEGAELFRDWIHNQVAENVPYNQFVSSILTASGSNRENPASSYFKILRDPESLMENTTHLFLATRFNCNKCHDHPFEKWTQDQYYEMTAFFARTSLKTDPESKDRKIGGTAVESAKPLYEIVYDAGDGETIHQRTSAVASPSFPFQAGGSAIAHRDQTRREKLADWLTSSENPYFASSFVNRLWGYMTGTGIIEPLDDIRAGNPPSNPALLEYLTSEFINSGFDTRHVVRIIAQSRTYQLSIETHEWNEDDQINFSHAKARRLPAEVLYDAIHTVLQSTPQIPNVAPGTRAAELPDSAIKLNDGFLGNFGRPARESSCECERSNDLQLGPVMALISGPTVGKAVSDPNNNLSTLISQSSKPDEWIDAIFQRILNRPANEQEIAATIQVINDQPNQHSELVRQLNEYQEQTREFRLELENQRLARITQAEANHNAFSEKWEAEKQQLTAAKQAEAANLISSINKKKEEVRQNLASHTASLETMTQWASPVIAGSTTSDGSLLSQQADGSLVASGPVGKTTYEIFLHPEDPILTGLRLDALTHASLPKSGPGRADGDGNFVLTEITAEILELQNNDGNSPGVGSVQVWSIHDGPASGWTPGGTAQWKSTENDRHLLQSTGVDPMLVANVDAGSGWFQIEVLLEVPDGKSLNSQLFFSQGSPGQFSEAMSRKALVSHENGSIQNLRFLINTEESLTSLRFDPHNEALDLNIFQISLTPLGNLKSSPLKFSKAVADFSQSNFEISKAINGDTGDGDGWAVSPQIGKDHTALFALESPMTVDKSSLIKVSLIQNYRSNQHAIGHFRLQTTHSEDATSFGVPGNVGRLARLAGAGKPLSTPDTDVLVDFILSHQDDYRDLTSRLEEARKPVPDDPKLAELAAALEKAKMPVPPDPVLEQLKRDVALSESQLENPALIIAQDLAWALINSPAFLFNH